MSLSATMSVQLCICTPGAAHDDQVKFSYVSQVLANDLNPISYKYLQQNVILNKVQRNVTAFNMDGRAFIRQQCNLAEAAAAAELQKRDGRYSVRQLIAYLLCIGKH